MFLPLSLVSANHLLFMLYLLVSLFSLYLWGPLPFSVLKNCYSCCYPLLHLLFLLIWYFRYIWGAPFRCLPSRIAIFVSRFLDLTFCYICYFRYFLFFLGPHSLVYLNELLLLCLSLSWLDIFAIFVIFVIFLIFVGPLPLSALKNCCSCCCR